MERYLLLTMIEHVETHVVDLHLLDLENFLVVRLVFLVLVNAEDSGQGLGSIIVDVRIEVVLQHEVHLSIVYEHLF